MKTSTVEIATILSHRTKQGVVEFMLNGEKTQWEIDKAKEIHRMLGEAIEAAVSDSLIYAFMTQRVGMSEDKASTVLLDFRELRQGSRGTVYPQ